LTRAVAWTAAGGLALLATAFALPAHSDEQVQQGRTAPVASDPAIGTFTPAVRDPRLAAYLAQRRSHIESGFRFTPATARDDRDRAVRVAVRVRPGAVSPDRVRPASPGAPTIVSATASGTQITPVTYNLGVAVGWRRFAITGDVSSQGNSVLQGSRESARIGATYRANRRLTGRVQVEAERAEGVERIVSDDRAVALDVGGSYSIARNLDVTGGVRYRVARDRIEPLARDERRDSQAVYLGTAFRF
jgi:hypothetical protein